MLSDRPTLLTELAQLWAGVKGSRSRALHLDMQLRTARLCLDCEELHEENTCPICASEMFAFLTRWVPAEERRTRRRPPAAEKAPESSVHSGTTRWVKRGAAGLAIVAASRWLLESSRSAPASGSPRQKAPGARQSETGQDDTHDRNS